MSKQQLLRAYLLENGIKSGTLRETTNEVAEKLRKKELEAKQKEGKVIYTLPDGIINHKH